MPLLLGTGPILGLLGAGVVVLGTVLPWFRQVGGGSTSDAYGVPLAFLGGWRHLAESGFDLGTALLIAAIVGGVVSMVRGGGIVRRVIGLAMILVCALYVLQWQDFLNVGQAGLGTGTNVWDIADYGVLVSFGGAVVMLGAPSR
jgi:hypothetical protein